MNQHHIKWETLVKYLSEESSLREDELVQTWIKMNKKNKRFLEFLERIWNSPAEKKHQWNVDSAWSRFNEVDGDQRHSEFPDEEK